MGRRDRHGLAAHPFSTSSQVSPLQLGDVGVGAPRPATGGVGGCVACALQPPHGWSARRSGWNSSRTAAASVGPPPARSRAAWPRGAGERRAWSRESPPRLLPLSHVGQRPAVRSHCPTATCVRLHPPILFTQVKRPCVSSRSGQLRPAKVFAPVVLGGAGTPGACTTKVPCGPHCRAGLRRRRYGSQERTLPTEEAT